MFISAVWKARARAALKGHWLTALLIALTVNLPTLLVQAVSAFLHLDLVGNLSGIADSFRSQLLRIAEQGAGSPAAQDSLMRQFTEQIQALLGNSGIWIMQGLKLLAALITPCLVMGMYVWMLQRLRGGEAGYGTVFSRLRLFLKGIGLKLLVTLKIVLWMLPGMAVSLAGMLPLLLHPDAGQAELNRYFTIALSAASFSGIVMAVPGFMAALRYMLADFVMADLPETGILSAVRESKRLTAGRKGLLFALLFSFILWYLAEMALSTLVLNLFGSVASLMVQMLAQLALTLYAQTSVCAFYESTRGEFAVQPPVDAI